MVELHSKILGHTQADFDKRIVRKRLRKVGARVQKKARSKVNRKKVISRPGEYPGRRTGGLFRAIKSKGSRSGFSVAVAPRKTREHGNKRTNFYAAYLANDTEHAKARGDYLGDTMYEMDSSIKRELSDILREALIIKKVK